MGFFVVNTNIREQENSGYRVIKWHICEAYNKCLVLLVHQISYPAHEFISELSTSIYQTTQDFTTRLQQKG